MGRTTKFVISVAIAMTLSLGCGDIDVPGPNAGAQTCTPKCAKTQVCFKGKCCTPNCDRPDGTQKECGADGCGGTCGNCPPNQDCSNNGMCKLPL